MGACPATSSSSLLPSGQSPQPRVWPLTWLPSPLWGACGTSCQEPGLPLQSVPSPLASGPLRPLPPPPPPTLSRLPRPGGIWGPPGLSPSSLLLEIPASPDCLSQAPPRPVLLLPAHYILVPVSTPALSLLVFSTSVGISLPCFTLIPQEV